MGRGSRLARRPPRPVRMAVVALACGLLPLSSCVADAPPSIGQAIGGDGRAMVSWVPPVGDNAMTITTYVITPFIGSVAQTPVMVSQAATSHIVTGLANGTTYTFVLRGINGAGAETASSKQSNPVTPTSVRVAAGFAHSCAITNGGSVKCWGENGNGQLGNGGSVDSPSPVSVTALTGVVALGAGYAHACALVAGGAVKCWGDNGSGQLGNGDLIDRRTPVPVVGISGAIAIAAGGAHTCAVLAGGAVKCWGSNYRGQLGNGSTIDARTPVSVAGLSEAVTVSASLGHTCAVLSAGAVGCWGANYSGALGDGTTVASLVPVAVAGINGAVDVAAGGSYSEALHTCAVLMSGAAMCWGSNSDGQLGNGMTSNAPTPAPVPVTGITDATFVTAGDNHTCVVVGASALRCWGRNVSGQLGNGTSGNASNSPSPVSVVNVNGASVVTAGDYHTCAVVEDDGLACWGYNAAGQLGNGTTVDAPTPVSVSGI
ncbi:MAG: fibronectin type III domain-containing protein [Acidimicrobiales bacterium]